MQRLLRNLLRGAVIAGPLFVVSTGTAGGQDQSPPADEPAVTLFPHSETARYWISGQSNIIFQWHPPFDADYSGPNSFRSKAEHATSNVATLFLGLAATDSGWWRRQRRTRNRRIYQCRRCTQSATGTNSLPGTGHDSSDCASDCAFEPRDGPTVDR